MNLLFMDRVFFTIFGYEIYWYSVFIASALIINLAILFFICKKKNLSKNLPFELVVSLVPLAIIFARIFYILFDNNVTFLEFFAFRDGGLSILGAIIGGTIGLSIYCLIKKVNFLEIADVLAPLLVLGQAIGRWGNYFNQEVYGQLVTNPAWQWFPFAVFVNGEWFQALFFYESILNLIGFALLIFLLFKLKNKKGYVLSAYLMFYGLVRFLMENLRQEEYILTVAGLPVSKIIAGLMFVIGLTILIILLIKQKRQKVLK